MAQILDIGILVVAIALGFMGASSGIIKELFRFAGLVGGFFVAFLFYRSFQSTIEEALPVTPPQVAAVMAFIVIALAVFLAIVGVGFLLRKSTEAKSFGGFDRLLGGALGAGKALVIAWAACLSISSLPMEAVTKTETIKGHYGQTAAQVTTRTLGPTQQQFSGSAVYRAFNMLPSSMRMDGLESIQEMFRRGSAALMAPADTPEDVDSADDGGE